MLIEIDFESDEAIYRQLCRQIVTGIATRSLKEGDSLPSVRDLAGEIGINMHTVNKAYSILREEGFLTVDKRHGAVVCLDSGRQDGEEELDRALRETLARASCRNIPRERVHEMIDAIFEEFA